MTRTLLYSLALAAGIGCASVHDYADSATPASITQHLSYPVTDTLQARLSIPAKRGRNKYAVLISGNTEDYHEAVLASMYRMVRSAGFQTYVLDSNGQKRDYPVDGPATRKYMDMLFNGLSRKVGSDDMLLVYTSDHGATEEVSAGIRKEIVSVLCLPNDTVNEKEFAGYLKDIRPGLAICLFDQCSSGGFAEQPGISGVKVASTHSGRPSYNLRQVYEKARRAVEDYPASPPLFADTICEGFLRAWLDGYGDADGNREVSTREAFDFAAENFEFHQRRINEIFRNMQEQQPVLISDDADAQIFFK